MQKPSVTIVCPCYQEANYIAPCLDSLLLQEYPSERLEILIVDGGSSDGTPDIVRKYSQRTPRIRLLENPKRTAPYAMNIGIAASRGDTVVRVDAHTTYPPNYVSQLVEHLYKLDAENVGGVLRTLPANGSVEARAVVVITTSGLGVGNARFRTLRDGNEPIPVDTVPFGCFRRDLFDRIGGFDERLSRNQDSEFNSRIVRNGGKIYLLPWLRIDYYARPTVRLLGRMFYQYGLFVPIQERINRRVAAFRRMVPPLFVAGLLLGPLLGLWWMPLWWLYGGVVALYLLMVLLASLRALAQGKGIAVTLTLLYAYPYSHIMYGLGVWHGLLLLARGKTPTVGSSR